MLPSRNATVFILIVTDLLVEVATDAKTVVNTRIYALVLFLAHSCTDRTHVPYTVSCVVYTSTYVGVLLSTT